MSFKRQTPGATAKMFPDIFRSSVALCSRLSANVLFMIGILITDAGTNNIPCRNRKKIYMNNVPAKGMVFRKSALRM
jgi:hypothetical protein